MLLGSNFNVFLRIPSTSNHSWAKGILFNQLCFVYAWLRQWIQCSQVHFQWWFDDYIYDQKPISITNRFNEYEMDDCPISTISDTRDRKMMLMTLLYQRLALTSKGLHVTTTNFVCHSVVNGANISSLFLITYVLLSVDINNHILLCG